MPSDAPARPPELIVFERFCRNLRLEQGRPLILEPFQLAILADYFGGARETLVLLSKKNGKTTLLAAVALYHLLTTPSAECVIGAASRDQASTLLRQAVGFVNRSEGLRDRLLIREGYREIRSKRDGGRIRVLAADVDTADGIIPTLALVDELGRHRKPDLYGIFRDGLGPRDGRMLGISAAGESEASPLGVIRAAARKLPSKREGRYLYASAPDSSFVLHEWALEDSDNVDDIETVKLVNPASWQSPAILQQRHDSPSMLPWQWARFACGMWVGAAGWWLRPDDWHAARVAGAFKRRDKITLGFDGSRHGDATALVGCRIEDGLLITLGLWEAPKSAVDWEVPGSEVDAAIANAMETYDVVRGYLDPPLWQTEIDNWSREYGDPAIVRYPTNRQRFMAAVERFRTDLIDGKIHHAGDERLTRHVLAAQVREARGGYWLDKTTDKIDAAIAAVLAYEARCDALAAGYGRRSAVPVSF